MRNRIHYGGGFEAAMHHAVGAFLVLARAVLVPLGGFHQFLEGLHIPFTEQITRTLPAEHGTRRVAPRRAFVGLIAGQEVEEHARLAERPALAVITALENIAEQRLRLFAVQEVLLIRRAFVRITRRHRNAVHAHGPERVEEIRYALRIGVVEQRAVDVHAETTALRFLDRCNG